MPAAAGRDNGSSSNTRRNSFRSTRRYPRTSRSAVTAWLTWIGRLQMIKAWSEITPAGSTLTSSRRQPAKVIRRSRGSFRRDISRRPSVTPNPAFKVAVVTSRISRKRCVLGTKLLENTNRKPYPVYRIPLSMTLSNFSPRFPSRYFSTLNISETTPDRAIVTIERQ